MPHNILRGQTDETEGGTGVMNSGAAVSFLTHYLSK